MIRGYYLSQLERFSAAAERLGIETISYSLLCTVADGERGWVAISALDIIDNTIPYTALIDLKQ